MYTLQYRNGALWLLDQTRLPTEIVEIECRDHRRVADAIRVLSVRGAPAIGLAAAYGTALAAQNLARQGVTGDRFRRELRLAMEELHATRPTAVNLAWALDRLAGITDALPDTSPAQVADHLLHEAHVMMVEDEESNRRMGAFGATLIPDGAGVLTHCNAGALATGAYGTAVGVLRAAHEAGKHIHVWVDETRPLLQGARLTAWELQQLGIPFTLITDNMAAHFMKEGVIDAAITGADRIAANGDAANKIGTYGVAVLARAHDIPLYIAAPASTVDLSLPSGDLIPIEQRHPDEVTSVRGQQVAPAGATVANPAFDVTPARLISAIITDHGIVRAPYTSSLVASVPRSTLSPGCDP